MANTIALSLVIFSVYLNAIYAEKPPSFKVIRQWNYINYTWPTQQIYETASKTGSYIRENIIIAGVSYFGDWIYLSMPRMKAGVPATLGRIPVDALGNTSPPITPFPSWEANKLDDCNALQNVQNTEITPNGEMWIIDGGHTNSLTATPSKNCQPKLIILDLNDGKIVVTHVFPEGVANKTNSFLYSIVVDTESKFAYITDNSAQDPGIIVFSRSENQSWKIRHPQSMKADPSALRFQVNGVPISTPINIAAIALSPKVNTLTKSDREVFYSPLSSLHLYSISASVLQNKNNAGPNFTGNIRDVGVKTSQTGGMVMSNKGTLYYGLLGDSSIAKWKIRTSFETDQKILCRDFGYLQWTNSFTIDPIGNLLVLTNTLQKFVYQDLDVNSTNFWLISARIGEKSYLYDGGDSLNDLVDQETQTTVSVNLSNPLIQKEMDEVNQTNTSNTDQKDSVVDTSGNDCKIYNVIVVMLLTILCLSL